jgi:hypothetical protein
MPAERDLPPYEALRDSLRGLPCTYYPDLLRALVEASYEAGTWQPGGASRWVVRVEEGLAEKPRRPEAFYERTWRAAHPHVRTDWPLIGADARRAWREKVDRDEDQEADHAN